MTYSIKTVDPSSFKLFGLTRAVSNPLRLDLVRSHSWPWKTVKRDQMLTSPGRSPPTRSLPVPAARDVRTALHSEVQMPPGGPSLILLNSNIVMELVP